MAAEVQPPFREYLLAVDVQRAGVTERRSRPRFFETVSSLDADPLS
jgi:hypothetical protein